MKCSFQMGMNALPIILQLHHGVFGAFIRTGRRSPVALQELKTSGNITDPVGHREGHCTLDKLNPKFVPRGFDCPKECPYGAPIARDRCSKVCVLGDLCGEIHPAKMFPDPDSMMCAATCGTKVEDRIQGCSKCAGVGRCAECATVLFSGFDLSEDGRECIPKQGMLWPVVYCCIALVALLLFAYLVTMWFRPTVNEGTLDTAMKHRNQCKPLQQDNSPYPLFFTNLHNTDLSGVGVMLYFNWVKFVFIIAFAVMVVIGIVHMTSPLAANTGHSERHSDGDCTDALASDMSGKHQAKAAEVHSERSEGKYDDFNWRMFYSTLACAIVIPAFTLWYSWIQSKWAHEIRLNDHKPHLFAVYVEGLAPEETDPLPINEFFEKAINEKLGPPTTPGHNHVVGTSICYDYFKDQDLVDEAVEAWIVTEDKKHLSHRAPTDTGEIATVSERRKKVTYALKGADPLLFFLAPSGGSLESEDEFQERIHDLGKRITPFLQSVTCSGEAYVVFAHTDAVEAVLTTETYEYRGQVLKIRPVQIEAPSVNWYAHTRDSAWHDIIVSLAILAATIGLWVAMYLPYALDYIAYTSVPGRSPNFFEDMLLGLLISIGNVIVANVIETIVPWWRLKGKDRRDVAVLSMGFMATFLNTICDLWLVMEIAKGQEINDAFSGEDTGYDRVLAAELMVLIVPGYLILPYVLTPFFEHVLPYVCVHSVVRTRIVARRQAELGLEPPPFDICWRYSDMCNNFTIATVILCFVTPNAWKVFCFLVLFVIIIYVIDYLKMVRFTSQTYYTTHRLSDTFSSWFAIPMTALCAVAVWWAVKCELLPKNYGILLLIPTIFCAVYCLILFFLLKKTHQFGNLDKTTYHETQKEMADQGKTFDYFNCNPVFCLRKKWLGVEEPCGRQRIVPYVNGKYYLQTMDTPRTPREEVPKDKQGK